MVVVGTRPEAIKLVPVILALAASELFRPVVLSSGQHHAMVTEVLALAGIMPDGDLWVGVTSTRASTRRWRPSCAASRTTWAGRSRACRRAGDARADSAGHVPGRRDGPRRYELRVRGRAGGVPPADSGRARRGGPAQLGQKLLSQWPSPGSSATTAEAPRVIANEPGAGEPVRGERRVGGPPAVLAAASDRADERRGHLEAERAAAAAARHQKPRRICLRRTSRGIGGGAILRGGGRTGGRQRVPARALACAGHGDLP